jgi:hypothetical protein
MALVVLVVVVLEECTVVLVVVVIREGEPTHVMALVVAAVHSIQVVIHQLC